MVGAAAQESGQLQPLDQETWLFLVDVVVVVTDKLLIVFLCRRLQWTLVHG